MDGRGRGGRGDGWERGWMVEEWMGEGMDGREDGW